MAKLAHTQKMDFIYYKKACPEYELMYSREMGVSVLAVYTGPMKNYVKFIVAHCGPNDTFKKKLGFTYCAERYFSGGGIALKAIPNIGLQNEIKNFIHNNFDTLQGWESLN